MKGWTAVGKLTHHTRTAVGKLAHPHQAARL